MPDLTPLEQRFAERVHIMRKARGWSARELSNATTDPHLTRVSISKIEKALRRVTFAEGLELVNALGVELEAMTQPGELRIETEIHHWVERPL